MKIPPKSVWRAIIALVAALALPVGRSVTISSPSLQNDTLSFSFDSAADQLLVIESSILPTSGWTNLAFRRGTGANINYSTPLSGNQRYFRIRVEPFQALQTSPTTPTLAGGAVSLPDAMVFENYLQVISPSLSGVPPYTLQIASAPPSGLTFLIVSNLTANASLVVSSLDPRDLIADQRRQFTLNITDASGAAVAWTYDIRVVAPPPQINVPLVIVKAGEATNVTFSAIGGSGALSWRVLPPNLPEGLQLNSAGLLTGTPTASAAERNETGSYTNFVEITDSLTDRVTGAPTPRAVTNSFQTLVRFSYILNIRDTRPGGPSLAQICLACHGPGFPPDYSSTAAALLNVKSSPFADCGSSRTYIVPGDVANSLILQKVSTAPPCGERMPFGGPYFDAATIERLARWVRQLGPQDTD